MTRGGKNSKAEIFSSELNQLSLHLAEAFSELQNS